MSYLVPDEVDDCGQDQRMNDDRAEGQCHGHA
jgi:hypothetical protein